MIIMTPEGAVAAGIQQGIVGIVLCLWSWDGEAMFGISFQTDSEQST